MHPIRGVFHGCGFVRALSRTNPDVEQTRPPDLGSVATSRREETTMADSDEVSGHILRLAQERRLIRFCAEKGIDPNSPDLDNPDLNLLAPIVDSNGEIVPDPEDIAAVSQ